jgi:transcription initiation factor TFIID subunit 5
MGVRAAATGLADSRIRLWSLTGAEDLRGFSDEQQETRASSRILIGHSGPVYSCSFSPDMRSLLSGSADGTARLWSLDTYSPLVVYRGHQYPVWDVAMSPVGAYFATASHDKTARVWCTERVTPLRILVGHYSDVETCVFHPNGLYLATGSSDRTCRLWDVSSGECVRLFTVRVRVYVMVCERVCVCVCLSVRRCSGLCP